MSKGHDHKHTLGEASTDVADLDLEAEHDPQRARNVSNAALHHEAKQTQVAEADKGADPKKLHEQADIAAYQGVVSSIDVMAQRLYTAAKDVEGACAAPLDESGGFRELGFVEHVYETMNNQLMDLQTAISTAKLETKSWIGRDLGMLHGALERFHIAMMVARKRFEHQGISVTVQSLIDQQKTLDSMYKSVDLDPQQADVIRGESKLPEGDLELTAIKDCEGAMHAAVLAVRARLDGPDAELQAEAGKLLAAVEMLESQLGAIDPSRIHSTKMLSALISDAWSVVLKLEAKPGLSDWLSRTALHNRLAMLQQHVKK